MPLLHDRRLALRSLAKTAAFTAVAVLTLAVSIGATTAVYSVVDGVLLSPLPFDRPEQLVRPTWDRTVRTGWPFNSMGLTLLRDRSRSYASIGVHGAQPTCWAPAGLVRLGRSPGIMTGASRSPS